MEQKIRISDLKKETPDAITVQFENHLALDNYTSGQFINVFEKIDQNTISRSYSFSSSPEVDEWPAVTIKRVAGGKLSGYLVAHLKAGDLVTISEPMGRFQLTADLDEKHLIFVAGGSGITPLYSMMKTALHKSKTVFVSLIYANQNVESIIFKDQLEALKTQFSSRFRLTHFLNDRQGVDDLSEYLLGHVSRSELAQVIHVKSDVLTEIYMCGPSGMMDEVSVLLDDLEFSKDRRFTETFVKPALENDNSVKTNQKKVEVTYLKNNTTVKFKMNADEFVLQSALNQGHQLAHSCKEAMCGSCKVKITSGKVKMMENYALTDTQVEEGYVLLCSSKPNSSSLTFSYQ